MMRAKASAMAADIDEGSELAVGIAGRLAPMLEYAGGGALIVEIDSAKINVALSEVEKLAREAEAALAAGASR